MVHNKLEQSVVKCCKQYCRLCVGYELKVCAGLSGRHQNDCFPHTIGFRIAADIQSRKHCEFMNNTSINIFPSYRETEEKKNERKNKTKDE